MSNHTYKREIEYGEITVVENFVNGFLVSVSIISMGSGYISPPRDSLPFWTHSHILDDHKDNRIQIGPTDI